MTPNILKNLARGAAILAIGGLAACASNAVHYQSAGPYKPSTLRPYEAGGQRYAPHVYSHYDEVGMASWYSYPAGARRTASGEWFDPGRLTAAHKTLPLWSAHTMDADTTETAVECLMAVVFVVVIPWPRSTTAGREPSAATISAASSLVRIRTPRG